MATPEEQNKIENNEIPKVILEKTEEKEISPEEFLNVVNSEEQKFKQETSDEVNKLNSVGLDQPTFEKIKNETTIEKDLIIINNECETIINKAKNDVSESFKEKEIASKEKNIIKVTQKAILESEFIEIKPENRNKEGELLAPNGQVSNLQNELHWKMVRTPVFKEWFGDWERDPYKSSKIVDKNGEPLIVYRGTRNAKELESGRPQRTTYSSAQANLGSGIYFTPYLRMAQNYGESTFFAFINTKNVKVLGNSSFIHNPHIPRFYEQNVPIKDRVQFLSPLGRIFKTPASTALTSKLVYSEQIDKIGNAEKYAEINILNEEDVMVIPAPNIGINRNKGKEILHDHAQEPGHNFLNDEQSK